MVLDSRKISKFTKLFSFLRKSIYDSVFIDILLMQKSERPIRFLNYDAAGIFHGDLIGQNTWFKSMVNKPGLQLFI